MLFDIQRFANIPNTNVTAITDSSTQTGVALSYTMKQFYDTALLENARAKLFYKQFAKKQAMPKNGGNSIEWRKFNTIAPALTPLTEGITPDGKNLVQTRVTASLAQYGDYVSISDRLELEAVDPVILAATEELGAAAGMLSDILTRNVTLAGTNNLTPGGVAIASIPKTSAGLISTTLIDQAVTKLKRANAPEVDGGGYICIIHPSIALDLRETQGWQNAHQYAAPDEIFNGEIGKLHGMRFVETTNAKVYEHGSSVTNNSAADLYVCTCFGKDAFATVDPTAESLEMLVSQRTASVADPLAQRSTVGYKMTTADAILYPERLVNLYVSCSLANESDDEN